MSATGGKNGNVRYRQLLNSIAKDLDCMLVDLCQTLPESEVHNEQGLSRLGIPFASVPGPQRRWPPSTVPRRSCLSEQPVPRLASSGEFHPGRDKDGASLDRALDRRHHQQQQQHRRPPLPTNGNVFSDTGTDACRIMSPTGGTTTFSLPASAIRLPGLAAPLSADDERRVAGGGLNSAAQEPINWSSHFDGYHNDIPLDSSRARAGALPEGTSWDTASESNGGSEGDDRGCQISVLERLIHTHPIWFLRGIYRAGAVHLLQGKEIGNFIIRQSSQTNTMAITVRLPPDKGPYIEHYLIEAIDGKLRLEGSDNHFQAIPTLVAHYCQCCDELPVQLTLPRSIAEAKGKQDLASLALLGQEFWTHSLGSPTGHWNTTSPTGSKPPKPVMPLPISLPPRAHLSTFSSPSTSPTVDPPANLSTPSPSASAKTSSPTLSAGATTPPVNGENKRTNRRPPPPPRWYTPSPGSSSKDCDSTSADAALTTEEVAVQQSNGTRDTEVRDKTESPTVVEEAQPLLGRASSAGLVLPLGGPVAAARSSLARQSTSDEKQSPDLSIESPPGCNYSSLADKVSDYEDLWVGSPGSGLSSPDDAFVRTELPASSKYGGVPEVTASTSAEPPVANVGTNQNVPPDQDELEIVKTLKGIRMSNSTPPPPLVAATRSWEYVTSSSNQTDQEKVLARHSLTHSEGGGSVSGEVLGVQQSPQLVRRALAQINKAGNSQSATNLPTTQNGSSPRLTNGVDAAAEKRRFDSTLERLTGHRHSDPSTRRQATSSTVTTTTSTSHTSRVVTSSSKTVSESRIYEVNGVSGDGGQRQPDVHLVRWKLPGLSSADTKTGGRPTTNGHNTSSSLTDLNSKPPSGRPSIEDADGGGFVNVGFKSSSSQLLAARDVDGCSTNEPAGEQAASVSEKGATLPRTKVEGRPPLLRECFEGFQDPTTPNSTLRRNAGKNGGKSYNESVWPLDSSWEFRSRNCGPLSSSSDSDSPSEMDYGDEDAQAVDHVTDDEASLVQLRNKEGGGGASSSRFPIFLRPPGNYILNSFLSHSGENSAMAVTVEDLLTRKQPQLRVPEIKPLTASNLLRVSAYDNLGSDDEGEGGDVRRCRRDKRVPATTSSSSVVATSVDTRQTSSAGSEDNHHLHHRHRLPRMPQSNGVDGGDGSAPCLSHRLNKPTLRATAGNKQRQVPSETGSSATEFSEPWDSSRWERLLLQAAVVQDQKVEQVQPRRKEDCRMVGGSAAIRAVTTDTDGEVLVAAAGAENSSVGGLQNGSDLDVRGLLDESRDGGGIEDGSCTTNDELQSVSTVTNDIDDYGNFGRNSFKKISALPCLLSLRRKDRHSGKSIRDYVFKMAQDKSLIFGQHIENFIQCTQESHEQDPRVVMRNIRQFMSGMANYLVNSGEGQFSALVQEERAKLRQTEFLNLDAILEGVLHKIVLRPLKQHICHLFVVEYTNNCAVTMLSDSIKFARTRTPEQLGIKPDLRPPHGETMELIKRYMAKLQRAYSPLKKLENLLAAISVIYQSILQSRGGEHQAVGADDFLPILTYVLVHCGLIAAEVEAEYMWGLLHPSLLSGEGGYYLTTLSSAVHVLKHLHKCHMEGSWPRSNSDGANSDGARVALCLSELDGFMKVLIPNEQNGSIMSKTVPVRPNMTAKDICKMVAHRQSVTNPQDYALFKLVNGEEILLSDMSCPWTVKTELSTVGVECTFAYKRIDAKMAWPVKPIIIS